MQSPSLAKRGVILLSMFLATIASILSVTVSSAEEAPDFQVTAKVLESRFMRPPADCGIGMRYWWWGSRVDRKELREQLRLMKAQSITDVEILGVYRAVKGPTVKLGSDAWVKNVSGCIEEAAEVGMNVWVTPTTGWPWAYNGPGDPFKAAACHLKHQSVLIKGPAAWKGKIPRPRGRGRMKLWTATLSRTQTPEAIDPVPNEPARIVTEKVAADGSLALDIPKGQWILTGFWLQIARHGTDSGQKDNRGPVVGFQDRESVRMQLEWLISPVLKTIAPKSKSAFKGYYLDNLEDYTEGIGMNLLQQFKESRKWDVTAFLPVLFLSKSDTAKRMKQEWDYVKTISWGRYGFGGARKWGRDHGVIFRGAGHTHGMEHDKWGNAGIPEFENYGGPEGRVQAGLRASSAARAHGRRIVSCESFTSLKDDGYISYQHPNPSFRMMSRAAANIFSVGGNKLFMHGYTYVPSDGSWFRNFRASTKFNHWHPFFPLFRGFADYVRRTSYVLQAGRPVSRMLVVGMNVKIENIHDTQAKYDRMSRDGFLVTDFRVVDGKLDNGLVQYGLVAVGTAALGAGGGSDNIEVFRKLETLVAKGARVVWLDEQNAGKALFYNGGRNAALDAEYAAIRKRLVPEADKPKTVGAGRVWKRAPKGLPALLASRGIGPQVIGPAGWKKLFGVYPFQHRRGKDYDLFYLINATGDRLAGAWKLAALGMVEEWDARTGEFRPMNFTAKGGYTAVDLNLPAYGDMIIVVRRESGKKAVSPNLAPASYKDFHTISGQWDVQFTDNMRKKAATVKLKTLGDWGKIKELPKGFQGIGEYRISFELPSLPKSGAGWFIELGSAYEVAEVHLNSNSVGFVWDAPYRMRVNKHLKKGANELLIKVASRWHKNGLKKGLSGPIKITQK